MKPLHTRLQEARKRLGLPWEILERDYLLSWILAGIGRVDALRDVLVFKGGTALKKCYFGDYSLEEIVAEKLRAILQHLRSLENRGWTRTRARDYYDLWRILGTYRDQLDASGFESFLREKCALREVMFSGSGSFFPEAILAMVEKSWARSLEPLVPNLPLFQTVLEELRPQIAKLLASGK